MGCNNSVDVAPEPNQPDNSRPNENVNPVKKTNADNSNDPLRQFRNDCLKWHNYYRGLHHSPPMQSDPELEKSAQAYAEKMAKTGVFAHSSASERNNAGENLFGGWEKELTAEILAGKGKECTDMFYNEINEYDFNNPGFGMNTGHFTQVVWSGSKNLGMGIAAGKNGLFIVARYFPAGNMLDHFEENVKPI